MELQTTLSSYISYRPCDLTGLCNHSPMTKMLSLEGVTLIYSSPDKINVIQAWHCKCHMKNMSQGSKQLVHSWKAPFASHASPCRRKLYRLPTIQNTSLTYKVRALPGAHTCRQTCDSTKADGTRSLLLPVWEIRLPLSVSSLSLCFEIFSSVPVLWAPMLLSKARETKTGGWKPEARGRMKWNILV